jgi:hypothetical protein
MKQMSWLAMPRGTVALDRSESAATVGGNGELILVLDGKVYTGLREIATGVLVWIDKHFIH